MLRPLSLRSTGVFALATCPTAALVGAVIYQFTQMDGAPGSIAEAVRYAAWFVGLSIVGYLLAMTAFGGHRSRADGRRWWMLPLSSGLFFSLFLVWFVEGTTDVVGQHLGYRGLWVLVASMIFWSALATAALIGLDRSLHRSRPGGAAPRRAPSLQLGAGSDTETRE